jgi:quercetin dioxygenase-like cupin family protein
VKKLSVVLGAIVLLAANASAQSAAGIDPVAVSPDKYKIVLDNEQVRVVEYSLKPGEKDNPHTHPAKVSYVLSGGTLRIFPEGGNAFSSDENTGDVAWMNPVPRHFVENTGTTPVRIVLFEIKEVQFPRVSSTKDPALVNPSSINVKLDNDSVRVMEADLPPGFQEKPHAHTPYVMYILNGGKVRIHLEDGRARESEFKPGDVFFSNPVTHWAENIGSSAIKVLLVEIRHK